LEPDLLEAFRAVMPTEFIEIWEVEGVPKDPSIKVWIVNPGQGFTVDDQVLHRLPGLELVVTPSTGRNHIDVEACARRDVAVLSLLDDRQMLETISASAEFTFLLLLNTLRRLDVAIIETREGRWREREDRLRGTELQGKLVGLVGLGRIGRRLARYCGAFDANVAFHDPYVDDVAIPEWSLEEIFRSSDAVCICCALTNETAGMVDYSVLRLLKANASLVNTSRGEVIVEADLVRLVEERPDVQVALDVLAGEATGVHLSSPLLDRHRAGRIVVTPHIAGASVESQSKAARAALRLVHRHLALPNQVG
jgi:phosphoglycerate dehydrogenase-like enzyme